MFIYEISGCGFESNCSHLDTKDVISKDELKRMSKKGQRWREKEVYS